MRAVPDMWVFEGIWAPSSEFGTYRLCEQLRFRRACACAVSPEPPLLAHTSSESRGTFRQKARSLAPLNGWACTVKICHDWMLEDTNSLDPPHLSWNSHHICFCTFTCAKEPPPGNGLDLSNTPILSRPRKPPLKMFLPSTSFLFTHL